MNSHLRSGLRFVSVVMLGALALVPPGRTQVTSAFDGKFRLMEPVSWQGKILPAGEYTLSLSSIALPAKLIVRGPKTAMVILASGRSSGSQVRNSVLTIETHGGLRYVRQLTLNNPRMAFVYWVPSIPKNERTHEVQSGTTQLVAITSPAK